MGGRGHGEDACGERATTAMVRRTGSETEVPGDHHALHLVRAFTDLEDLLVAIEPGDRELVDEPVAAVDLERPVRRAVGELTRVELRLRRRELERAPLSFSQAAL